MGWAGALRDATWLNEARARGWCRVLALVSALGVLGMVALSRGGLDPGGKPLGTDFISFYSAGKLAAAQGGAAAYDVARHAAAQAAVFPQARYGYTTFLYPPAFLLVCLPLALLPYGAALAAWLLAGLAVFAAAMRPLLPRGGALPLLSYPALLINAGHGQNACLTAACFAGYMSIAGRAPFWGGACLGLLIIKPQLGLAVPFVLLAGRRWAALAGAAASASLCAALATAVLGFASWPAFLAAAPAGRTMLLAGLNGFAKMPSLFAGLRLAGLPVTAAMALHIALAVVVLGICAALALRALPAAAEGALLASAALLLSPWSFDYDLVVLAPPLAWVARCAGRSGFLPWEKIILFAAYILPLAVRPVATAALVPLGPPVLLLLFLAVSRRARMA